MKRLEKRMANLESENAILKQNVAELQRQLQESYKRIGELTKTRETTPIDRNYKWWSNANS